MAGSIQTSGTWRVGIGSPITGFTEYSLVPKGVHQWDLDGVPVVKKVYIRRLTTGSLIGE